MNLLLAYHPRHVRLETIKFAVCDSGFPLEKIWFRNVEGDDYAYWRAIREAWSDGDDLLFLEHDVVPVQDEFRELVECSGAWCQLPYGVQPWAPEAHGWVDNGHPGQPHHGGASTGSLVALGCTKFSKAFIATNRERVMDAKPAEWWNCDTRLFASFSYGPPHLHAGCCLHLKGPA